MLPIKIHVRDIGRGAGSDLVLMYGRVKQPNEFLPGVTELLDLCRLKNRLTMTHYFQLCFSVSLKDHTVGVKMPTGSLTHAYNTLHNLVHT